MDKKINLIPQDLAVPASTIKIKKIINKISIITTVFLLLSSLAMISLFIFYSINIKKFNLSNSSLKEEVVNLEKTEQQLTLTKDRISKIVFIKSLSSANTNFKNYLEFKTLVSNFTDLKLGETEIDSNGMNVSISSTNISSFVDFIKALKQFDKYPNVLVSSLILNPKSGLILNLNYGI